MLPELKNLPERFVWARKQAGLSQAALANELKVSQQSIEKLENGHVEKPKYLKEAAERLEVPYKWLLDGEIDWAEEKLIELKRLDQNGRQLFDQMLKSWPREQK
jgi:transcriptional regulator with XRE-family HTH domain